MKITRTRGDTCADQFAITMKVSGQAADLSGCSFLMTLSRTANPTDSSTQVYQLTGEVGAGGVVSFYPTEEQANQIGTFYFDVQMQDAQGRKRTIVPVDTYTYTQDITK